MLNTAAATASTTTAKTGLEMKTKDTAYLHKPINGATADQ